MPYLIVLALGLFAGWVVNYLSDVLPVTRSLSRPVCHACSAPRSFLDYLLLRRCIKCRQPRTRRTHLTHLVLVAVTAYIWFDPTSRLGFWPAYVLLVFLGVVFVIDVEHRLILHPVSLVGAALGLGIGTLIHGLSTTLYGGAVGFLSMLVLYYFGEWFARYMSRRRGELIEDALGFGDVNLAGIVGLLLGWPLVIFGLLFTILVGGAFSILYVITMMMRRKYEAFTAIPYAPFLILSVVYALYR
jgi:leader peptidase (prepilin peptidase)/N-methyltransferase